MNEVKKCSCCGEEKPLDMFSNDKSKKDGKFIYCKECKKIKAKQDYKKHKEKIKIRVKNYSEEHKEQYKKYKKVWYRENKEEILLNRKIYYKENKEQQKEYHKKYWIKNKKEINEKNKKYREENKEELRIKNKIWREENKKHLKEKYKNWKNKRLKIDQLFKLKYLIGSLIRKSFVNRGYQKNSKTENILGCSIEEFKQYLEKQFEPWMSWDNYGNKNGIATEKNFSWDIDHIIPISSAKTEEDILKLNHYTNLQPLDSFINRCIKRDKILIDNNLQ